MTYYFSKTLKMPFGEAIERTTEERKKEGFGILTEIDVKATLKKKLDVDFRNYRANRVPGWRIATVSTFDGRNNSRTHLPLPPYEGRPS